MIIKLEERFAFRAVKGTRKEIKTMMKYLPECWDNEGHFIRSAIIRQLREFKQDMILRKNKKKRSV